MTTASTALSTGSILGALQDLWSAFKDGVSPADPDIEAKRACLESIEWGARDVALSVESAFICDRMRRRTHLANASKLADAQVKLQYGYDVAYVNKRSRHLFAVAKKKRAAIGRPIPEERATKPNLPGIHTYLRGPSDSDLLSLARQCVPLAFWLGIAEFVQQMRESSGDAAAKGMLEAFSVLQRVLIRRTGWNLSELPGLLDRWTKGEVTVDEVCATLNVSFENAVWILERCTEQLPLKPSKSAKELAIARAAERMRAKQRDCAPDWARRETIAGMALDGTDARTYV
jgi:hypothetical protein